MFPIRNGLKQGYVLMPLLFNSAFRVCHYEGSGKSRWLEIKWYTSAFGYADVNILGGSIHTLKKNTEKLC